MSANADKPGTPATIKRGVVFDTPHESGCVAVTAPDLDGNFDALDSDGVRCSFSVRMVVRIREGGAE